LQVVETDFAVVTAGAGDLNNAGLFAEAQQRKQPRGQSKVREIVGAEMKFESFACELALEKRESARIIDEQVNGTPDAQEAERELGHRSEALQIELFKASQRMRCQGADSRKGFVTICCIAAGNDDIRTGLRKRQGEIEAEATC
jgi:hypothetical protein